MKGGQRNLGMRLRNNTSGLNALRFDANRVYVAFGAGRTPFSTTTNGIRGALQLAMSRRLDAGYPTPTLAAAMYAFRKWKVGR